MKVGRAIRILRETNDVPLSSLAKRAELSVAMLSMIEKGQREPSLTALRRIAEGLSIPMDVMLAAAQPGEGTLQSSDERSTRLAEVLDRLENIEQELRNMMCHKGLE